MMKITCNYFVLFFLFLLSSCASNFTSFDQVRSTPSKKSIVISLPLDTSYDNLLTKVSECYALRIYKVVSFKKNNSGEISVISAGATSGANIWLSINLEEISNTETKASLYWGNANWEKHAEKAIKWAAGEKIEC